MTTSWHFFAVSAATQTGFAWQWQKKRDNKEPVTSASFDFYFDCISDARANGYAGPLPAGPKVPLQRLPVGPLETPGVLAALPPKGRSGQGVMTVTAVSPLDVKRRSSNGRSRVNSR